jgi:uncharacterized membrane protein
MPARTPRSTFDRVYSVVVALKGVDGTVELLAGLILLVAPRLTGSALDALATELAEGTSPLRTAAAQSIAAAGGGLVAGAAPLAVFLLIHGAVKLLTVSALLRRAIRWYPWALLALVVLFLVQLIDLITAPAIGGWVLVGLDVLVISLVAWEYERLRKERAASTEAARARRSERLGTG